MDSYKINDYILLKLESNGNTAIYVGGKIFLQCYGVLLNIPKESGKLSNEFKTIDQISENYKDNFEKDINVSLTPEEEFMVHCSNIQAWVENDYNTNILHSNISFPLLEELSELGDPKAKKVFKKEIIKRFLSGELSVILFLLKKRFHSYLDDKEKEAIFLKNNSLLLENIEKDLKGNDISNKRLIIPVLKELMELGDQLAREFLKQKIIGILSKVIIPDIEYLLKERCFSYFSEEENKSFFLNNYDNLLKIVKKNLKNITEPKKHWVHLLLERLVDIGDSMAKELIKQEIIKWLKNGNFSCIRYLLIKNYFHYFNKEESNAFFLKNFPYLYEKIKLILKEGERERKNYIPTLSLLDKLISFDDPLAKEMIKLEVDLAIRNRDFLKLISFLKINYHYYYNAKNLKKYIFLKNNEILLNLINEPLRENNVSNQILIIRLLIKLSEFNDSLAKKMIQEIVKQSLQEGNLLILGCVSTNLGFQYMDDNISRDLLLKNYPKLLDRIAKTLNNYELRTPKYILEFLNYLIFKGNLTVYDIIKDFIIRILKNYNIKAIRYLLKKDGFYFLLLLNETEIKDLKELFFTKDNKLKKSFLRVILKVFLNYHEDFQKIIFYFIEAFDLPLIELLSPIFPELEKKRKIGAILDIMEKSIIDFPNLNKNIELLSKIIPKLKNTFKNILNSDNKYNYPNISKICNLLNHVFNLCEDKFKDYLKKNFSECNFYNLDYVIYNKKIYFTYSNLSLKLASLGIKNISDIKGIEKLTNLQSIDLSYNELTDLRGIENLKNLERLDISHNKKILNFSPLYELRKLKEIKISEIPKDIKKDLEKRNIKIIIYKF
ncbi:MAG: leucine-rich repeat domain-containing protein [Promethearchaeota archaeon]